MCCGISIEEQGQVLQESTCLPVNECERSKAKETLFVIAVVTRSAL